jgi:hypothetical protein
MDCAATDDSAASRRQHSSSCRHHRGQARARGASIKRRRERHGCAIILLAFKKESTSRKRGVEIALFCGGGGSCFASDGFKLGRNGRGETVFLELGRCSGKLRMKAD